MLCLLALGKHPELAFLGHAVARVAPVEIPPSTSGPRTEPDHLTSRFVAHHERRDPSAGTAVIAMHVPRATLGLWKFDYPKLAGDIKDKCLHPLKDNL